MHSLRFKKNVGMFIIQVVVHTYDDVYATDRSRSSGFFWNNNLCSNVYSYTRVCTIHNISSKNNLVIVICTSRMHQSIHKSQRNVHPGENIRAA